MKKIAIANWEELEDRTLAHALLADVDLVIVRYDDNVSVLYGRCAHRGALMADGHVDGNNLICGVHGWDYRLDTGISEYKNSETLPKFSAWIEDGQVLVDEDEIASWAQAHPQPYNRDAYQGAYQDPTGTADEPHVKFIRKFADEGLSKLGHHGRRLRWVYHATVCPNGTIFSSWLASYTNCRCWMRSLSEPAW